MHELMKSADERLQAAGLVEVENGEQRWFPGQKMRKGMIGDDHVPVSLAFLVKGIKEDLVKPS